MKRPFAVCLAALVLAGCRSPGQTTDPFFGRSTVEPPRTGAVSGTRAPAYYSGAPANSGVSTPRQPTVGAQPNTSAAPVGRYTAPTAGPTYGANQALTSSPPQSQLNQRLLPASGPLNPPRASVPSVPSPWATGQAYGLQPAPAATTATPAAVAPTTTAPLTPVGPQPPSSAPAIGPTLRPAASIPAPTAQGQCVPVYPCYPYNPANPAAGANCGLAGRQRIVRPLQTRQCAPCPAGTVPVPCVPVYSGPVCNPYPGRTPSAGAINITDLPVPKAKL